MVFLRTLRSHHFHALLKPPNPSKYLKNPLYSPSPTTHLIFSNPHKYSFFSSIIRRPISLSVQFEHNIDTQLANSDNEKEMNKKPKKPLDVLFKEAIGLSEKLERSESEDERDSESGTKDLKKKLRNLEVELRSLKENKPNRLKERQDLKKKTKTHDGVLKDESKARSLYAVFTKSGEESLKTKTHNGVLKDEAKARSLHAVFKTSGEESLKVEEPMVYKELSSEMGLFANYLYEQGYFKDANFLPKDKFDATCFENSYGRDFLKFAAEKFGKDKREITKWLSGSDLKKVALFGCPSLAKKAVFSAKSLRYFFEIPEDTVCGKCVLKQSCKFVNQSVWKSGAKNLDLAVVMRVITLYALESVPPQLVVPDEIKASVSQLLKEVLNLSQTVS